MTQNRLSVDDIDACETNNSISNSNDWTKKLQQAIHHWVNEFSAERSSWLVKMTSVDMYLNPLGTKKPRLVNTREEKNILHNIYVHGKVNLCL